MLPPQSVYLWSQLELGATLIGIEAACAVDGLLGAHEVYLVGLRHAIQIVEIHQVAGGVVVATHEPNIVPDKDAVIFKQERPYLVSVKYI